MADLWHHYLSRYHAQMTASPALTKCTTGATVFCIGDLGSQTIVEGANTADVDLGRAARAAMFGGTFSLWLHHWWGFLEKAGHVCVPVAANGSAVPNTLFKLFWDQTFSALLFNAGYIAAANCEEGASIEHMKECIEQQLPDQMVAHWKFWPLFHLFWPCSMTFWPYHAHHRFLICQPGGLQQDAINFR